MLPLLGSWRQLCGRRLISASLPLAADLLLPLERALQYRCSATSAPPACRAWNRGRATVLDGRAAAAAWEKELLADVQQLTRILGRPPGLGVVLVGNRPDSMLYVAKKQEACQKAGMYTYVTALPASVSQSELEAAVSAACADTRLDGLLIQLPLPGHLSEEAVMEVLDPRKDVDGFHPLNMGRMLMRGRGVRLVPATPLGCMELLRRSGVEVQGKNCVVLGDSNIVGTPLAAMLRDRGAAAVTICHRRSFLDWFEDPDAVQRRRASAAVCLPRLPGPSPRPAGPTDAAAAGPAHAPPPPPSSPPSGEASGSAAAAPLAPASAGDASGPSFHMLRELTRTADILVVAVGHPELVKADWVRPGAVVIDVGINVVSAAPRSKPPAAAAAAALTQSEQAPATAAAAAAPLATADVAAVSRSTSAAAADGGGVDAAAGCAAAAAAATADGDGACCEGGAAASGGSSSGPGDADASGCVYGGGIPYNRSVTFRVVGDVAFEEVSQVAGAITPVPGGVGPMTIAAVLHNTIKAAKYRAGLETW